MRKLIVILLIASCSKADTQSTGILGVVVSARASQSFYVSASGSDAAAGAQASPFATIAKLNDLTFQAGDTIKLNGGDTFSGNLLIQQSGAAGNPIYITSYGTGKAIISAGNGTGIKTLNSEYITVDNLSLVGSGVSTTGVTTNTGFGLVAFSTQTSGTAFHNVHFKNCTVYGFKTGIMLGCDAGTIPQTAWRGFTGDTIVNNDVSRCGVAGIWTWSKSNSVPSYFDGTYPEIGANTKTVFTNLYIANNKVYDMYGSNSGTWASATFGTGIRMVNASNFTVESNYVNNVGHCGNGIGSPAAFEAESCADGLWQYNEAANCRLMQASNYDGAGFDVWDGNTSNQIVQFNYIHDNDGYGIGGGSTAIGTSTNHIARFNILVNNSLVNHTGDIQAWGALPLLAIYCNTVYSSQNGDYLVNFAGNASGAWLANNIFYSTGTRKALSLANASLGVYNNLYWIGGVTNAIGATIAGTDYNTLSAMQAAGLEKRSGVNYGVVGDPLLSSPGTAMTLLPSQPVKNLTYYDFPTSSPAYHTGVFFGTISGGFISEGNTDYHLNTFSTLSIGAVQY